MQIDPILSLADRLGWPMKARSILVEGEHDQRYLSLAARLYEKVHGRSLLGGDLAVFPPGTGDDGGTHGIQRLLPTMRNVIDAYADPTDGPTHLLVTLMDGDSAGKAAARSLTSKHMRLAMCRDVFVLHPVMPRKTREPGTLAKGIERANAAWRRLDCEIEDLISTALIDLFCEDEPSCAPSRRSEGGRTHHHFDRHAKGRLVRFVEGNAMLDDISELVEVLKSLRFYVGLDPEGVYP